VKLKDKNEKWRGVERERKLEKRKLLL